MKIEFLKRGNSTNNNLAYVLEKRFKYFKLYKVFQEIVEEGKLTYKYLYKTTKS